ncbi:FKBP-type peptidyl-prolyl cis-trans isomerase [Candidatus Parabeggiatoa sp. HSG14]|uniref:FKBP-type peptidyl-prolyl cis-trans isomerase n=1 Tax=Candidatus Parabeggiatoa sp. HSG14 TaxID=3055593 RepID=UPI0025A6E208|nr:FKBP-type peptidyl-prolyl cis-trans isomerase [Thiotrichales bacterium HSG14]
MKLRYLTVLAVGLSMTAQVSAEQTLTSPTDQLSYTFGYNIGQNLTQQGIKVNLDAFANGLNSALSKKKPLLTPKEMNEVMTAFQKDIRTRQLKKQKQQANKNIKEGEAFLAKNAKKPGVVTLSSGLQYKVLTPGKGKTPKSDDKVTTHYEGTLINGEVFDSSKARKKPATFPVNGVIAGWTEALQLMKEGAKWQLFIPANLAYGERGAGGKIGPNATLIFEIELISVDSK